MRWSLAAGMGGGQKVRSRCAALEGSTEETEKPAGGDCEVGGGAMKGRNGAAGCGHELVVLVRPCPEAVEPLELATREDLFADPTLHRRWSTPLRAARRPAGPRDAVRVSVAMRASDARRVAPGEHRERGDGRTRRAQLPARKTPGRPRARRGRLGQEHGRRI